MKLFLVPAFLLLLCSACSQQSAEPKPQKVVQQNTPSQTLSDVSLYQLSSVWHDQNGREVSLESLRGKPRIVAMIFTNCTYACPRITADMQNIGTLLPADIRDKVGFVLFSMDPERDTPTALAAFAQKMELPSSHWTLLCSTEDNVQEMAAVLGVKYKKDEYGNFSHSNMITILNGEGEVIYKQEGLNQDAQEAVKTLEALYAVQ